MAAGRVNFPNNCYSLDIAASEAVRREKVLQLFCHIGKPTGSVLGFESRDLEAQIYVFGVRLSFLQAGSEGALSLFPRHVQEQLVGRGHYEASFL